MNQDIFQIQLPPLAVPVLSDTDYPDIEIPTHLEKLIEIGHYTRGEVISFIAYTQQLHGLSLIVDPVINSIRDYKEKQEKKKPSGLILPDQPKILIPS